MPRTIVAQALRAARLATMLMTTALTGYGVCAAPAAIRADDTATWPLIVTADRAEDCAQTLTAAQHADNIAGLGTTFSLLNWNVEKAKNPGLLGEFAELAKRSDLIFLQEAVPLRKAQTLIEESLYDAFVRGYVQNEIETGVLTLARTPHRTLPAAGNRALAENA